MQERNLVAASEIRLQGEFFIPRWYVLFVRSNQEKHVARSLGQRGIEHFLPCYSSLRQWKDRRVRLDMPLFPGYVFARLPLANRLQALTVPHVVSLVGRRDAPAVMSPEEIEWIRNGTAYGRAEPHTYLQAGQQVMITAGLFAGMRGILLRRGNGLRLVIGLESIARAFVVEVDEASVEAIPPEWKQNTQPFADSTAPVARSA
jgi:transcription antitermination factor NusG